MSSVQHVGYCVSKELTGKDWTHTDFDYVAVMSTSELTEGKIGVWKNFCPNSVAWQTLHHKPTDIFLEYCITLTVNCSEWRRLLKGMLAWGGRTWVGRWYINILICNCHFDLYMQKSVKEKEYTYFWGGEKFIWVGRSYKFYTNSEHTFGQQRRDFVLTVAEHFVLMCVFPPLQKKFFFLCFPSLHNNLKPSVQTHTHAHRSFSRKHTDDCHAFSYNNWTHFPPDMHCQYHRKVTGHY